MKVKTLSILVFLVLMGQDIWAQCAMCKTTIVNNVSHGELTLAEGLNFGIAYLFFAPYLVIAVIAGTWFYLYRKHGSRVKSGHSTL